MMAQNPSVTRISLDGKTTGSIQGKLEAGVKINDLSWAWSSANACFPETQKQKFTGNHVLYEIELPAYSEMTVTVIPDDKNADFSIYAYQIGVTKNDIVPNLSTCVRCEADHKWDYKKRGQVQDHSRTVKDLVAIANPFKVIIGVVGSNGLATGGYTLQVNMSTK